MKPEHYLGLDNSRMINAGGNHWLLPDTCAAFQAMQTAASIDGIDIQLVSSYRSFERQCAIWNAKWQGDLALRNEHNQILDPASLSDTEKMHAILLWSALPGASRHHWGTDIDVYDKTAVDHWEGEFELISAEYCGDGPCATLSVWLDTHAPQFNFFRPYERYLGGIGAEPWHLSYRPIADKIAYAFDKQALSTLLRNSDLLGWQTIEAHFDEIYHRYVLNKGIPIL